MEIETDKVTVEMPSPVAGVVSEIVAAAGDTVAVGALIARIEEGAVAGPGAADASSPGLASGTAQIGLPGTAAPAGGASAGAAGSGGQATAAPGPASSPPQTSAAPVSTPTADTREGPGNLPRILPAARRLIAEHGLDAADIAATGKGGRLLKSDVLAFLAERERQTEAVPTAETTTTDAAPATAPAVPAAAPPAAPAPAATPAPAPAPAPAGPAAAATGSDGRAEERVPMTPIRRRIAERLVESQQQAALLTTFNEIDMSAVMGFRRRHQDAFTERHDVRLGFLSFFVKAAVDALRRCPRLNAEISGTDVIYRNYHDIGIAVSTDRGLMVPVLRNAGRLSFAEIESTIGDYAARARKGRIRLDELSGGTFTITNGGVFGSLLSTPIINPPQSGVLGLHAIQQRPVVEDGQIVIRPMMYVALTYDHRIVDGREAVTFLVRIKEAIQEPARMLIEV